ncbi:NAD-dependent epimerase/dehydratase family protein [Mycolicibacterium arenosum]|uniref:NAD-dependent epimerase/dehydratase family protein n=1 Tax=Mycolicibacterium arenosum TaxID=2952157 RepID=A0ABT1M2U8_9MYCO|nr:NAD-dependent epimerase/dehydratase family protein [Mycolicibacterium sp. CAU 1645]MCP9273185.1 NAD-dependent epimerase/dehydratase family protein [Mycolicibacterium sp. CAU 1645]
MNDPLTAPVTRRTVVVTGASGNVASGVLRALAQQFPDAEIVGVCRRPPTLGRIYERVRWHAVDLSAADAATKLGPAMAGADVVIHLALATQPVRNADYLYRANVLGTAAVLQAMHNAGIEQLVYASSLGVYAPGAPAPVDETWPDTGQQSSTYSRHKVLVERMLDDYETDHPGTSVARFRPTVVVQREAAALIRSLYLGPLVPRAVLQALHRGRLPLLPLPAGLALQFVHADDVGDAVVRLMERRAVGSFNIAADALDRRAIADLVGARPVEVNAGLVRAAIGVLSATRLVALTTGWYDVATATPVMDTTRARNELGWVPSRSSAQAAHELLDGLASGAVGTSAAMGRKEEKRMSARTTVDRIHDASLALWSALTLARALGFGRAGVADAAVIAVNLASGTPMAIDRVRQRRRDPAALLAPVAVTAALAATRRGGWSPVIATSVLNVLAAFECRRTVG